MGLAYRKYLDGNPSIFVCYKCKTHLSTSDKIFSKQFHGQHGQAFLFEAVVNIEYGKIEDRQMSTGLHRVKDVFCGHCSVLLGWAYIEAFNVVNKYKEGKFVLEKNLLIDLSEKNRIHVEISPMT
ncbi:unnamed protein product [Rhizopus stolonifer]